MKIILSLIILLYYGVLAPSSSVAQPTPERAKITHLPFGDTSAIHQQIRIAETLLNTYPDSALLLLSRTLRNSQQLGYDYGIGWTLMEIASAYRIKERYAKAENAYYSALPHLQKSTVGRLMIPRLYSNLGNIHFLNGNYESALTFYYKGIDYAKAFPDLNVDFIYNNLSGTMIHTGRNPESTHYYLDKAEKSARKNNNYVALSKILNNKGLTYSMAKQWDSSLYYFHKTLTLAEKQGLGEMIHLALSNIGTIYLEQHQLDSALHYLLSAYRMDSIALGSTRERTRGALGMLWLRLKDYQKATPLLLEQYARAEQSGNKSALREAHYNLSKLYGAQRNFKAGYLHAWNYIHINDTIAGAEVIQNVNKLEVDFRTAEKEKKIIQSQLTIARQEKELASKNTWITLILASSILLLMLLSFLWRNHRTRQKLIAERLQNLENNREIDNLRATITGEENERIRIARELHDGIGALISAAKMNLAALGKESYSITNMGIYQSTAQILDEAGAELRVTAHNMMPKALVDGKLIDAINAFCNYTRESKKLQVEVQAYGNFEALSESYQLGIYRIIQELINNIVKHAKASQALVQLMWQDSIMSITVEDNGLGFKHEDNEVNNGIGLQSIRTRVKSMNGTFTIRATPGKGTSAYIEFDMNRSTL